ncbi:MAG: hypothetical protein MUF31_12840 [Akkermansiaceae bacterium]|nr:hypothetical protein [Akkermansiaceae bacterium]
MRVFRVILVLGAILHLTGGHWGVLQCVAWGKMLVDYSQKDGLLEGARKTFDGEHPCCMCKSIAAAKQQEKKEPLQAPANIKDLSLKDLMPPASGALPEPRLYEVPLISSPSSGFTGREFGIRPPSPPPRFVA